MASKIHNSIRTCVADSKKVLSSSKSRPEEICEILRTICSLLPHTTSTQNALSTTSSSLDFNLSGQELEAAKREFGKHYYVNFLEFLCDEMNLEWYGRFGRTREVNELFNRIFLDGYPEDSLLVLCSAIQSSSPSFKQKKCAELLEELLRCHCLQTMMSAWCDILPASHSRLKTSDEGSVTRLTQWDQVITLLVTLPDRMTSKLKAECSDFLYPDQYVKMVAMDILQVLHNVHQKLSRQEDCSLQLVSQLIGKLCLHGHTERLFDVLLPHLVQLSAPDFIWSRIATRILAGAPDSSLEPIMEYILKNTLWYGHLSRLLGDAVLTNPKINLLLTNKFILLRHYNDVIIPQNLIGYFASSPSRRHLVLKVLKRVLDTWGDRSAVKHTSHSQHSYLTKIIVISMAHLSEAEKSQCKGDLTTRLMTGMQAHLEAPLPRIRQLGMVTAEIVTATLDPDGPKLKFDYEENEESRLLWSLVKPPDDPGITSFTETISDRVDCMSSQPTTQTNSKAEGQRNTEAISAAKEDNEELDSDDEFEPYNMSCDTKVSEVKVPVYVRDCMDGLIARENPELTEASLRVAEKLIRSRPDDLKDVCGQFAAILLHLEDQYNTENFRFLRHSAMVALSIHCPFEASSYLTQEFYNRNYNLRQRMDILEVLAAAAQELSRPAQAPSPLEPHARPSRDGVQSEGSIGAMRGPEGSKGEEDWRQIVQQRIDNKTRRFAKGPSKPAAVPIANRFAPVAGNFFFPLLQSYDSKMNTMDLLGGDFLLLGRLIYTLGVIMYAAQNAPVCRQMASSLLDLVWSLRYHTEQYVRQSLMFTVSMVTLSVPAHLLVTDLQSDIFECRLWLNDIMERDPEPECKALAAQTLTVIDTTIKKELNTER